MLILEIALGIVLAVVVVRYWDLLLVLAALLLGVAVIVGLGIFVFTTIASVPPVAQAYWLAVAAGLIAALVWEFLFK